MRLKPHQIETKQSTLVIHIDNLWSSREFSILFETVNRLYDYNYLLVETMYAYNLKGEEYGWPVGLNMLPEVQHLLYLFKSSAKAILNNPNEYNTHLEYVIVGKYHFPLLVRKIKYGSRGNVDILGLGKIFEIIKELLIHYLPNKDRKIDVALKEQELISKKIENLSKMGFSFTEIQSLIGLEYFQIEKIKDLTEAHKIIDFEIIEESER